MKIKASKILLTCANGGIGHAFLDKLLRSGISKFYAGPASLALALILIGIKTGYAQSAPTPTPTTKILAIGTINPDVDVAKVNAILPGEVKATVDLYLEGKIDQWYSLQDRKGVAFILNVTNPAAAHEMLEKLPLGQAHMMSFELIPLDPLNPLRKALALTSASDSNQRRRGQKALLDPSVKRMNGTNRYEQLLDRMTEVMPQPIRSSPKIGAANGQDSVDTAIFAACSSQRINKQQRTNQNKEGKS